LYPICTGTSWWLLRTMLGVGNGSHAGLLPVARAPGRVGWMGSVVVGVVDPGRAVYQVDGGIDTVGEVD
jgi:hypothetical protein